MEPQQGFLPSLIPLVLKQAVKHNILTEFLLQMQ